MKAQLVHAQEIAIVTNKFVTSVLKLNYNKLFFVLGNISYIFKENDN